MYNRHIIRLLRKYTFTNVKACKAPMLLNQKRSFCLCVDSSLKHCESISVFGTRLCQRTFCSDSKVETEVKNTDLPDSSNEKPTQETSFEAASSQTESAFRPSVVYMRGLPYSVTKEEITQFFQPLGIKPSKIILRSDRFGFSNGKAEAEFETAEEATIALKKHNHYIGNRYIELSLETFPQMNADRMYRQQGYSDFRDPFFAENSPGFTVKLSGLPYDVLAEDIRKFFGNLNIKPVEINLKHSASGQPLGLCFVKFQTREEALEALKNNDEYIGHRYIKVTMMRSGQGRSQYSGSMYDDQRDFGRFNEGIKTFEG